MEQEDPPTGELHIRFLGGFRLTWGGEPLVRLQTPLFRRLLAYLILHRRSAQSREYVAFLLWPDVTEKKAKRNLRQLLYRLRRRFPQAEQWVEIGRKTIRWRADAPFSLDVAAFTEAVAGAEEVPALEEAVAMYGGPLLPGFYDEWVLTRREQLQLQFVAALHRLVEALAAEKEYRRAIGYARLLLEAERLREATYELLLELHIARCDRAAALRVYREAEKMLAEAFGVAPGGRLQALQKQALALPETAPAARPVVHLPPQPTPFVGREHELAEIGALLQQGDCRLLTLTGLGGSGKTRLALEAARQAAGQFPDGVYFVSLSSAHGKQEMLAAVASALNFSLDGRRSPLAQLGTYLRRRRLLLLLDSFERVREGAPLLADILEAAPGLTLLVTSRQVLALRWEWRYPVPGLSIPSRGEAETPARLAAYDAVALFLEIAGRIRPDFVLTEANAPAVSRICRLVEGLPLALELAAVWLSEYAPAEIAACIAENIDFLKTPLQDVPRRQCSLYATFDYSWQQLPAEQQQVLARLSAFPASFTTDAALAVAAADEEMLAQFRARSLLSSQVDGESERWELHDLLREYALERLEADKATAASVRERHADYYLHLLAGYEGDLRGGPQQQTALETVAVELDHVLAARRHATQNEGEEMLQPSTFPLFLFLQLCNRYAQGREIFCAGPALPVDSAQHGHQQAYAAHFHYFSGEYARAHAAAVRAVDCGRVADDLDAIAAADYALARIAYTRGAYRQAERLAEAALALHCSRADRLQQAACYNLLGLIHVGLFDHTATGRPLPPPRERSLQPVYAAEAYYRRARALYRETGHAQGEAIALHNLGFTYLPRLNASVEQGERERLLEQMRTYLEEAASLFRQHHRYSALAQSLNWLGNIHARWLDRATAVAYFQEALSTIARTQDPMILMDILSALAARLWLPSGRVRAAATLLTLVEEHPAADVRVRRRARKWLAEAERQLAPAAFDAAVVRGRRLTAEEAAQETAQALAQE